MSIQAMTWALSLPDIVPSAKLTLVAIGNYADENGHCFPSIRRLAADTSQSYDTVSRRLRELEGEGLLVRIARYMSPEGELNRDGRGRRTSDEIRLRLEVTPATLKARRDDGQSDERSEPEDVDDDTPPANCGGQIAGSVPASSAGAAPALVRDLEPSSNLQDSPPNPPPGGVGSASIDSEVDADLEKLVEVYPAPIADMRKTRDLLAAMTAEERQKVLVGAKGYRAYIDGERRRTRGTGGPGVKNAHSWIRNAGHLGYLAAGKAAAAAAAMVPIAEGTPQWDAWMVFYRLAGQSQGIPEFKIVRSGPGARSATLPGEWPPIGRDLPPERATWAFKAIEGTPQFAAWRRRLQDVPNVQLTLRTEVIDGRHQRVLQVPMEWPPRKDGSTCDDEEVVF